MEYKIHVRNHWWFDAGIVGLYFISKKLKAEKDYKDIEISFDSEKLVIKGDREDDIRKFLEDCYHKLVYQYWNVSTKEQIKKKELVIYDKNTGNFTLAPKRQPIPVVSNFVKGSSWKTDGIDYEKMDEEMKNKVDKYLNEQGKSLWGKSKKLLFAPPECQPKVAILPKENMKRQSVCSICGKLTSNLNDISQPAFLLFASNSATTSFHTQGKRPPKICWECELLSKFTVDTVNYKKEDKSLYILLLASPDLMHNINNQNKIGSSSAMRVMGEDFFYKNIGFDEGLISKAKMAYELLWAYFVDTYSVLNENNSYQDFEEDDPFKKILGDIVSSPIEIIVMSIDEKGQTFITKDVIFYNDVSYAYRLIKQLLDKGIDIKEIFYTLYETDSNGNLKPSRDNLFKKMLNKHCILNDMESIAYRKVINGREGKYINVSNMLNMLIEYYLVIKGDIMNREQIEVAVKLGKQIVNQAYKDSGENRDVLKRIKGDLFTLRKTRTVTDFLTQLNTLQFRYGISVSNSILEGMLNEVPFEDFKNYCIMGALNIYNFINSGSKEKEEKKDE